MNDLKKPGSELVPAAEARTSLFPVLTRNASELQSQIENFGSGTQWTPGRIEFPAVGGSSFGTHEVAGDEDHPELDVILLGAEDNRSYFSRPIEDVGQNATPDCSSAGALVGLGTPAGDCKACPLSKFGSAPNGFGQACRLRRKLLFVRKGKRLPEVLTLAPTSVRPCSEYFSLLFNDNLAPDGVITRISIRKEKNPRLGTAYPVAAFRCLEVLTPEQTEQIREISRFFRGLARKNWNEGEMQ